MYLTACGNDLALSNRYQFARVVPFPTYYQTSNFVSAAITPFTNRHVTTLLCGFRSFQPLQNCVFGKAEQKSVQAASYQRKNRFVAPQMSPKVSSFQNHKPALILRG
jgi:hypothetical protein